MNSREKGKRGERLWRDELRANGYHARRGQQYAGGGDSPDVVCEELSFFHFEVKAVERLNIEEAMEQARKDCELLSPALSHNCGKGEGKIPIVAHKRCHRPWLVTMDAATFFRLLRVAAPRANAASPRTSPLPSRQRGEGESFESNNPLNPPNPRIA